MGIGLIFSLLGLAACIAAMFMPWFDNTQISVTGLTTVRTFGATLVVVLAAGFLAAGIFAFCNQSADVKKRMIFCGLRALGIVLSIYALMGVRKLMVSGQDNLPVTLLAGAYMMLAGLALLMIGTVSDLLSARKRGKKTSTIDLVLIVMTAAIYAAALLTLSFIKLAPGTWLRPANALQAPFGILFGLPGCIGITVGNFISDLTQGTAPHIMVMGALTNFLTAFIPYLFVSNARLATRRSIIEFVGWGSLLGALIVASSIYINVMFGLTPKAVAIAFFPTTFLNQLLPSLLLGIPLCKLLYPFVIRSGLYRGRDGARDVDKLAEDASV
jgi:energy-coupling factor transport system substrate-specific component